MSDKPKISARDTFIIDADMIDELDDMSLTSVIRDFETTPPNVKAEEAAEPEADKKDDDGEFVLSILED